MGNDDQPMPSATPIDPVVEVQPLPAEAWTVLAATGSLVLGQADTEFAVYDGQRTYGRWPRTEDGYRLASDTYRAYAQSPAHGLAYTVSGYQDPASLNLPTDPVLKSQTYSAPLSFIGSSRRIIAWAKKTADRTPTLKVLTWVAAVLAVIIAWAFVSMWYFVIFGLFGIFALPYRLIRRSQRKNLHVQRTALATQQAMLDQQRAMMAQQGYGSPGPYSGPPPAAAPSLPSSGPPPLTVGPGTPMESSD